MGTHLQNKAMVDISLCDICIEILALDKPQEKLVYDLDMRPSDFQDGLILFRIKSLALRRNRRRNRSEKIAGKHVDHARVHWLGDYPTVIGDVIQEFVEGKPLDLLGFHIGRRVVEVKDDVALVNLLHEQILASIRGHFMETRQLFQFPLRLIGDVESRRVLAFRRPNSLRHVLWGRLKTVKDVGLSRRGEIARHCLRGAGWRNMLRVVSTHSLPINVRSLLDRLD